MDGQCTGSKVMDFIDDRLTSKETQDTRLDALLETIEIDLYLSDIRYSTSMGYAMQPTIQCMTQIDLMIERPNAELDEPIHVSKRTLNADNQRLRGIKNTLESHLTNAMYGRSYIRIDTIQRIKGMIDFNENILRR